MIVLAGAHEYRVVYEYQNVPSHQEAWPEIDHLLTAAAI